MFASKSENAKAVEAIIELLKTFKRGDTVPKHLIMKTAGIKDDATYQRLAMRARTKYHEETGIWSHAIHGVGVRLQTERESATDEQSRRQRRIRRQQKKAVKAVAKIDRTAIPDDLRVCIERIQESARRNMAESRRIEKECKMLNDIAKLRSKPSKQGPIRVVPPRPREETRPE